MLGRNDAPYSSRRARDNSKVPCVDVRPQLLRWARERAGLPTKALAVRFPKYLQWENGEAKPTFKQLQKFAKVTNAPLGSLLLSEPPDEPLPIPDFRTVGTKPIAHPSLNLRDVLYLCQLRQEWFRDYSVTEDLDPVRLVGSASLGDSIETAAARTRIALNVDLSDRAALPTWTDALRQFIKNVEGEGVLVMISGIVGNNTHRPLNPSEFRGFALVDDRAPIVFVNGADTKAAQMFTVAHELAHVCLGQSALSNIEPSSTPSPSNEVEAWCNRFAAELLVPIASLRKEYRSLAALPDELKRLARSFKVSTLVILRRLYDLKALTKDQFRAAYEEELGRLTTYRPASGGNFYATQASRVGERFARALVTSTLEGQTLYRDAFHLLGFKRISTFQKLANQLGVA